jgi:hypothetical protein
MDEARKQRAVGSTNRRQLAAPQHPAGPTPAQLLMEEYKRRKAAGLTN